MDPASWGAIGTAIAEYAAEAGAASAAVASVGVAAAAAPASMPPSRPSAWRRPVTRSRTNIELDMAAGSRAGLEPAA